MDTRVKDVGDIETRLLFDVVIDLAAPLNFGGGRILFAADRGTFEGPKLRGEVVHGGGDWTKFRADGTMELDVRLALRTDDDALIYVFYGGRWAVPEALRDAVRDPVAKYEVDPSQYYFRTQPLFETAAPQYQWLNDLVCVGQGYLVEGGIAYRVDEVL